jgi:hypothetical protein
MSTDSLDELASYPVATSQASQETLRNATASLVVGPLSAPTHLETMPECQAHAITLVENNDELSNDQQLQVIDLFRKRPEIADLCIVIKKPVLRTRFLQGKLKKFFCSYL